MNFSELEKLMSSRSVTSLAEIARTLNTTPQAVSNWKARNQVPYHVVAKLKQTIIADTYPTPAQPSSEQLISHYSPTTMEGDTTSFSDILLTMAEHLKVIVLTTFISVFLTFTYVQFIKQPQYISWATVLLPSNSGGGNLGGLAGLASQFGVSIPMEATADLSSPSLYPELLRSRTFAEKILDKEFYIERYDKKLPLLSILTHGDKPTKFDRDRLIAKAVDILNTQYLEFDQNLKSTLNPNKVTIIRVHAPEPRFAKELAEVVLVELEALNRDFKSQNVSEKYSFIENRIGSVEGELEYSEQALKEYNETNRLISSPALQLGLDRLTRNVEVQTGIYLTLKQQLELAKIEEVQETSIVQVLDKPQMPLSPANKNLKGSVLLAGLLGLGLGIMLGFIRTYVNNTDMDERKKLRRVKNFFKKKGKDLFTDRRISAIVSILLLIGLPFYLGYESKNPVFFGMYSATLMLVNIVYVLILITSISLFIYHSRKKR